MRSTVSAASPLRRFLFWSASAVFATGLSTGCGGGDENADIYDVTVSVLSGTDLNSLHFQLGSYYHDGDWIGDENDLECEVLVDADLHSEKFGGDPGRGPFLEHRLTNDNGFDAPNDVIRCAFKTSEKFRGVIECQPDGIIDVGYFCVELEDATNVAGSPSVPDLAITSVEKRED